MNRRLPIGIQSFRRLRETDSYYVDKTPLIRDLLDQSDYCFLSRPRRFGKSLLLDTLRSLFEGHEELFRGLDLSMVHCRLGVRVIPHGPVVFDEERQNQVSFP